MKLKGMERRALLRVLSTVFRMGVHHPRVKFVKPVSRPLFPLIELALAEEEGRMLSVGELQKTLGLTQSATSRLVAAHLKAGTIEVRPDKDARKTVLCLSKKGVAYIDEVLDVMHKALISEGVKTDSR